jgi:hypothetical protein
LEKLLVHSKISYPAMNLEEIKNASTDILNGNNVKGSLNKIIYYIKQMNLNSLSQIPKESIELFYEKIYEIIRHLMKMFFFFVFLFLCFYFRDYEDDAFRDLIFHTIQFTSFF